MGRFICFEGLDGAGKTTTAELLYTHLQQAGEPVVLFHKKDATFTNPYVAAHMGAIRRLIWDYSPDDPLFLLGDHHWLYLMASWFATFDQCRIRPALQRGVTVIVDNWCYKFLSRYKLKEQLSQQHVFDCFSSLSKPDIVIFLDASPHTAARRKLSFSTAECGNMDGLEGRSIDNFLSYQTSVQAALYEFALQDRWFSIQVTTQTPQEIVQMILAAGVISTA